MSGETAAIHETCGKHCGKPAQLGVPAADGASAMLASYLGIYLKPLKLLFLNTTPCIAL
jgi:hypothetical protein